MLQLGKIRTRELQTAEAAAAKAAAAVPFRPLASTQQATSSQGATTPPSHSSKRVTRAQLADKLERFVMSAMTGTERKARLLFETEFRGDIAALIAAAEGGDSNAMFIIFVWPALEEAHARLDYINLRKRMYINLQKRMSLSEGRGAPDIYLWSGSRHALRYISVEKGEHRHWDFQYAQMMMDNLQVAAESMPQAQHILGLLLYYRNYVSGTKADFLDAARWTHKVAMQGSREAQYELGEMLRHGLFYDKINMRLARKYIRRASEQGHVEASACMKELRSCVQCGTDDAPLACSRCRQARYCNSMCSEKHWNEGGGIGGGVSGGAAARHRDTCPRTHTKTVKKAKAARAAKEAAKEAAEEAA
jgi:hypothetical protein